MQEYLVYVSTLEDALYGRATGNRGASYFGATVATVGTVGEAGLALVSSPTTGQLALFSIAKEAFLSIFREASNAQLSLLYTTSANSLKSASVEIFRDAPDLFLGNPDQKLCASSFVSLYAKVNTTLMQLELARTSASTAALQAALEEVKQVHSLTSEK